MDKIPFEPLPNSFEEEPSPKPRDETLPEAYPPLATVHNEDHSIYHAKSVDPSPTSSVTNDFDTAPAAVAASATPNADPAADAATTAPFF